MHCREQPTCLPSIYVQLVDERRKGFKTLFISQAIDKLQRKQLSIKVALEIEDVRFDRDIPTIVEGRTCADIRHCREHPPVHHDTSGINAIARDEFLCVRG